MTKRINGRSSKEFRAEAVKLVIEGGISVYEASRQFAVMRHEQKLCILFTDFYQ